MKDINIYLPHNDNPVKTWAEIEEEEEQIERERSAKRRKIFDWALSGFMIVMGGYYMSLFEDITILVFGMLIALVTVSGFGREEE